MSWPSPARRRLRQPAVCSGPEEACYLFNQLPGWTAPAAEEHAADVSATLRANGFEVREILRSEGLSPPAVGVAARIA